MEKIKIGFFFGAGAEAGFGLNIINGYQFKKRTIQADKVAEYFKLYNYNVDDNCLEYKISNGCILHHNQSSVLYQTLAEQKNLIEKIFKKEEHQKLAKNYIDLKKGKYKTGEKQIKDNFFKLYKSLWNILSGNVNNDEDMVLGVSVKDNIDLDIFLENAGIYSYVDSLFNYLRNPTVYKKEVARVMKLYFSAHKSILDALKDEESSEYKKYLDEDSKKYRKEMSNLIKTLQENKLKKAEVYKDSYYFLIKKLMADFKSEAEFNFVTTNYTFFAEKTLFNTQGESEKIAYLHGRLDLFESLYSKRIMPLEKFEENDIIFPYILIQSGVKPIFSSYEIEQFYKAQRTILESDYLYVIGYGFCLDDEHIINFFRERLDSGKEVVIFIYDKDRIAEEKIRCIFTGRQINHVCFRKTSEFVSCIEELKKVEN